MIGRDEYIIKIGSKSIKSPFLNPLAKKLFWKSVKSDKDCLSKNIKVEWRVK